MIHIDFVPRPGLLGFTPEGKGVAERRGYSVLGWPWKGCAALSLFRRCGIFWFFLPFR